MKKLSRISFFFFLLLAIGCNSQIEPPTSLPVTATIENTEAPKPTSTPTTSLSPTSEQITIEFPEWVKNPETQILLVPIGTRENGYENMALFNAETGEKFDVPLTTQIRDYFWMEDGSGFGFLSKGKQKIVLFSIKDDIVINIQISKEASRFLSQGDDRPEPIQITNSNFASPNFLLLSSGDALSPDKNYFIYQEKYDKAYTNVFDISENKTVYISDPNDEFIDLYSKWSPNSSLLAITEVDQTPEMFNDFKILPTFRLRVYDVKTQQTIASYKNVTVPNWSPDGLKFLFQEWIKADYGFYSKISSPPCVYDTIAGTTNCYYETLADVINQFSSLNWSPNQSMISYISSQGFCMITLSSTDLQCILESLGLENQHVNEYSWSPDSNFIVFEYDSVGAYSDDTDTPKIGISNIKTGDYFTVSENISFSYLGLWRPSPIP